MTMKLYYKPGACALACHISIREAKLDIPIEKASKGKLDDGTEFARINPKNYTPVLQLEDGQVLTEGAVIMQYIGDRAPKTKLISPPSSLERYREQEWLNYIATEIHKGFSPFFSPKVGEYANTVRESMSAKFDFLSRHLESKQYLMGDRYTVADGYLYTILRWVKEPHMELTRWPVLVAYRDRVAQRPAVQEALKEEGLT